MIIGVLTPDNLARKTFRAIVDESGTLLEDPRIKIYGRDYSIFVMDGNGYDESYQISAPEGSIVVHDYLTYGYGEWIEWDQLALVKHELKLWLSGVAERHQCSYSIRISANYF
jgi:hypothetical protein